MFYIASILNMFIKNRTNKTFTNLIFMLNANESKGRKLKKLKSHDINRFGLDLAQIKNSYGTLIMSYDYNDETHTIILNENQSGFYFPKGVDFKSNILIEILDIDESGNIKVNINNDYIPD